MWRKNTSNFIVIWCFSSDTKSCPTLWPHGLQRASLPCLSFTISWSLLKFLFTESVMPSKHLNLCRSLSLPALSFSQHQLGCFPMSWLSTHSIGVLASVLPMNTQGWCPFLFLLCFSQHQSGCFPMSWLSTQSIGVLASVLPMNTQGWCPLGLTGLSSLLSKGLKSFLQHHNSKASIIWCSVFFTVQLSHPYMTTGKTIVLTIWTFGSRAWGLWFLICCLSLS